jgi:hypothetical protein
LLHDLQKTNPKKARSSRILPLCSFVAKHVTVNTTVLYGLLKRIAKGVECDNPGSLTPSAGRGRS